MLGKSNHTNSYDKEIHTRRERIRYSVDTANNLQRDIDFRARRRVRAYMMAQKNLMHYENSQNEMQIKAMIGSFQRSIDALRDVIETAEENIRLNNRILLNKYPTTEYEQDINRRLNTQAVGTLNANLIPDYVDDINSRCRNFLRRLQYNNETSLSGAY
ncbi:MAG: hypothetical protein K6D38_01000 [Pseudobutyrivibrio sp.]|nr:hypothetical protein [Pseudobutyrivibrio sp.]